MSNIHAHSQSVSTQSESNRFLLIHALPFLLVFIRFFITLVLLVDALDGVTSKWFVPMLSGAAILDGIDGALARYLGVATKRLREADSTLDFVMAVVFVICCWLTRRSLVLPLLPWLVLALALNLVSFLPAIIKFGSLPPYHTYSGRITGVFLLLAAIELFSASRISLLMSMALFAGFLNQIDRVMITLILPSPPNCDVRGFWHALQIRDRSY